jgi:hypothetical protein
VFRLERTHSSRNSIIDASGDSVEPDCFGEFDQYTSCENCELRSKCRRKMLENEAANRREASKILGEGTRRRVARETRNLAVRTLPGVLEVLTGIFLLTGFFLTFGVSYYGIPLFPLMATGIACFIIGFILLIIWGIVESEKEGQS